MGVAKFFAWLTSRDTKKAVSDDLNKVLQRRNYTDEKDKVRKVKALVIDANSIIHDAANAVYSGVELYNGRDYEDKIKEFYDVEEELSESNDTSFPRISGEFYRLKKYKDSRFLESEVIRKVIQYIVDLIIFTEPMRYTYIAIDGPAPAAKMMQTRKRRYYSENQRDAKISSKRDYLHVPKYEGEKETYMDDIFNRHIISSGTMFMDKLHRELLNAFSKFNKTLENRLVELIDEEYFSEEEAGELLDLLENHKIMYSSHRIPGEGEQKIFNHLRKGKKKIGAVLKTQTEQRLKGDEPIVLFGKDADLIILSLLLTEEKIIVMKDNPYKKLISKMNKDERKEYIKYGMKKDRYKGINLYVNIEYLRRILLSESMLKRSASVGSPQEQNTMKDFAIMTFFLGNDFIPRSPAFLDLYSALDSMVRTYRGRTSFRFTEGDNIDWVQLSEFMTEISNSELEILKNHYEENEKLSNPNTALLYSGTKSKRRGILPEIDEDEFYRIYYKRIFNVKNPEYTNPNYKSILDNIPSSEMASNYIEAIQWIFFYYTGSSINKDWTYNYHYSPRLIDVVSNITANISKRKLNMEIQNDIINRTRVVQGEYLSPLEQLCYILPKSSLKYTSLNGDTIDTIVNLLLPVFPEKIYIDREGTITKRDIEKGVGKYETEPVVRINVPNINEIREVFQLYDNDDVKKANKDEYKYTGEEFKTLWPKTASKSVTRNPMRERGQMRRS